MRLETRADKDNFKNFNRPGRELIKNEETSVDGKTLTIKVDLSKKFGPSSYGKTIIIASTEGNVVISVHEEDKIGLNICRKTWSVSGSSGIFKTGYPLIRNVDNMIGAIIFLLVPQRKCIL